MKTAKAIALFVACCLFALATAGCMSTPGASTAEPASQTPASAEHTAEPANGATGGWALPFDTVSLDGTPVTQADFAGNTLTVLNIWATWCPPCIAELPHLQEMSDAFAGKGVQIVGVLEDGITELGVPDEEMIATGQLLMEDAGANYLVILPDEVLYTALIRQMQYFPTTYFLNADGDVVKVVVGANSAEDWEAIIDEVLATTP